MWSTELPLLLRSYVSDISPTPKYQDTDLHNFILLAGNLVQFDVTLNQVYFFDIVGQAITPDPTSLPTPIGRDDDAIALVIIRAGSIILETEVRNYGSQAIAIKDGKSSIDLKRDLRALNELSKEFANRYSIAKNEFIRGNGCFGISIYSNPPCLPYYLSTPSYWYTSGPRTYGDGWSR